MDLPYDRFSQSLAPPKGGAGDEHASRSPVAKDRDRIIHCGAFRRLQRKSQIVGTQSADFFRTRLTHTLECAQIGRALASRASNSALDGVVEAAADLPDLIEAAALAHDLGHPPFGHNGEVALTSLMRRHAGGQFEGNAQSFRICTFLEPKKFMADRSCGLDLTRTTLNAILKYPWTEDQASSGQTPDGKTKKFCIYDEAVDREVFAWIFETAQDQPARTIATDMLEAVDDIAYAAHDFEVWSRLVPLSELIDADTSVASALVKHLLKAKPALFGDEDAVGKELAEFFDQYQLADARWASKPFDRSRRSRAELKRLTAAMIGDFIEELTPDDRFVGLTDDAKRRLALLKGMAWVWMIENPEEESVRYGQRRLIEALFEAYWENPMMLPNRELWEGVLDQRPSAADAQASGVSLADTEPGDLAVWKSKARIICDHVAGMTDLYALHIRDQMFGGGSSGLLRLV